MTLSKRPELLPPPVQQPEEIANDQDIGPARPLGLGLVFALEGQAAIRYAGGLQLDKPQKKKTVKNCGKLQKIAALGCGREIVGFPDSCQEKAPKVTSPNRVKPSRKNSRICSFHMF